MPRRPLPHGPNRPAKSINARDYRIRLQRLLASNPSPTVLLAMETLLDQRRSKIVSKVLPLLQAKFRGKQTRRLKLIPVLRAVKAAKHAYVRKTKAATTISKLVRGKLARKKYNPTKLAIQKRLHKLRTPHLSDAYKALAREAVDRWRESRAIERSLQRASSSSMRPSGPVYGPGY